MAVRYPLYYSGGNLIAMTAGELTEWKEKAIYVYAQNPSAILTVVSGSGANISAMSDTRTQAGATSQSSSAFVAEGSTAEPSTVTVSYDKINLAYTTSGVGNTTDTGTSFPVYYDSDTGSIRAMSLTDIKDTFVHPCVDLLVSGTESATTAGTYTITTSATAATNYTKVSADDTAVFLDTRANTSAYTAAGIPETLDQPQTITSYYLHERDGTDVTPSRTPLYIDSSNNLQEYTIAAAGTLLGDWLRYVAGNSSEGYKIVYETATSGSGNTRGSSIVNTKLDGSGAYYQLLSGDDYRSQEFPNGSAQTIATYNLRINKT